MEVNRVRTKNLFWISLVALLLSSVFMVSTVAAPTSARMYVDPPEKRNVYPPATFHMYIKVDVTNLYAWEFTLTFTPSLLKVNSVARGSFLGLAGPTLWQNGQVAPVIDNVNGLVTAGDALDGPPYPSSGATGTGGFLADITFQVINQQGGICILDLQNTELDTLTGGMLDPIPHTVEDGLFDNRQTILPPNAGFAFSHPGMLMPVAGLPITFDASASNDNNDGGWITSYNWDFGDGTTGSGKVVDHTFATVGAYTVTLTVTDNDGLLDIATASITLVDWMEGGTFPDLVEECAWPELVKWHEVSKGLEPKLFGLVGNPTNDNFKVYIEFTIFSTEDAKKLGTLKTETFPISSGETLELSVIMNLHDTKWRVGPDKVSSGLGTNLVWAKYTVFARCYHNVSNGFQKGFAAKDFGFKVHPAAHEIAITSVTTNATNGVQKGTLLDIYVNMANVGGECGHLVETFNITVTYKGITTPMTVLEVRPSYLKGAKTREGTRTETFTLDTSTLTPERYVIMVTLSTLTYERNTLDNSGTCLITIVE
jgi:PKD repeat protein